MLRGCARTVVAVKWVPAQSHRLGHEFPPHEYERHKLGQAPAARAREAAQVLSIVLVVGWLAATTT